MSTTVVQDTAQPMWTVLLADFRTARRELVQARGRQLSKDTPFNRARVARALERVDAVLDTYLDVQNFLRGPGAAASSMH